MKKVKVLYKGEHITAYKVEDEGKVKYFRKVELTEEEKVKRALSKLISKVNVLVGSTFYNIVKVVKLND